MSVRCFVNECVRVQTSISRQDERERAGFRKSGKVMGGGSDNDGFGMLVPSPHRAMY